MDTESTGRKIAQLRKDKGWTQSQLAQELHVTDKAVSKWERGCNYPDIALLEALARTLDSTVLAILGLEGAESEEVAGAFSRLSAQEREKIRRELRRRSWLNIVCALCLWAATLYASYTFSQHNLYGLPQVTTAGMSGVIALIVGNAIFTLRKIRFW